MIMRSTVSLAVFLTILAGPVLAEDCAAQARAAAERIRAEVVPDMTTHQLDRVTAISMELCNANARPVAATPGESDSKSDEDRAWEWFFEHSADKPGNRRLKRK